MILKFTIWLFATKILLNDQFINILAKENEFVEMAKYGMIFFMGGIQLIGASAYQSFDKPYAAILLVALRQLFLMIPFLLIFSYYFGLD